MTADDSTPSTGHESTDFEMGTFPLEDATDERLGSAIEEVGDGLADATGDVTAGLAGEGPVTDPDLERVRRLADSLSALAETAVLRVPADGQHPERRG